MSRTTLQYRALGGFAVERDGVAVTRTAFGREKARMLLAALLCANGPVHREVLLDWLWPDLDAERGMRAFHVTLHALRRALEPELPRRTPSSVILTDGEAYRVVLRDGDAYDVAELLELAKGWRNGESEDEQLERLVRAESAADGELLPEWPYAPWAEAARREVERTRSEVLASLGRSLLDLGRPAEATIRFRRLIEVDAEREEWHRLLMRALAEAGERPLALRQYHACRAVLRRELGIEPGPDTRNLYRQILLADDGDEGEPSSAENDEEKDGP